MLEKELLEFFLTEAEELLIQLEEGFLKLDKNPSDREGIQDLFRTAHTLKGSAALVKLNTLSELAHKIEDVLEGVTKGRITVTKKIVDWFLNSLDAIKYMISETVNGKTAKVELTNEICNPLPEEVIHYLNELKNNDGESEDLDLEDYEDEPGTSLKQEPMANDNSDIAETDKTESESVSVNGLSTDDQTEQVTQGDVPSHQSSYVKVHINKLDKMMGLVGELTILKNYFVSETEGSAHLKTEIQYACSRLLKEIEEFDSRYAQAAPEKISYVDSLLEDFRELEFDRYDGINLFANSVKEIMSDVNEAVKSISDFFDQFSKHTGKLDVLNLEFRDLISESRMVETGNLFQRFTRIIRDLSDKSGKKVNFVISGGHTRIDRILYEKLFTPLLHLVRNAFSHGIESSEERSNADKTDKGSITLSSKRDGNTVVIDIHDDGGGINLLKVRKKAVSMGLIQEEEEVLPARLLNLLFMPGFSTHDEVDMTSGRGVGLDAVRQIISEMNGTLSIATDEGKGTTFRIKLPLTLIVVNTVKLMAGGLEFSVPSSLIQELMDVDVSGINGDKDTVEVRGNEIPLKDLCGLLGIPPVRTGTRHPIIVFSLLSGKKTALMVDEILGQEDTVISPPGGFLEGLKCYSGFSISADAKLSPVLNPVGLFESQFDEIEITQVPEKIEISNNVLVVDDSLSVRKFASIILEQNGYNVLTAPNGLEAFSIIEENQVDLILTDLEMPIMHGYELLRELKRRGLSDTIPAIVLTSRNSEKHKEKATQLGAKDYLVKPFEESTLIETIRRNIKSGIIFPAV